MTRSRACAASRARPVARSSARIVAVTGSVGKTGTKEALRACLARVGATHAAEKSFNNHWGVPLTLARMPADARYGVFEIGMNHAGEITPLTKLVRPHVAIVTTVEPVHLEYFGTRGRHCRGQGRDLLRTRAGRHGNPQPRQPILSASWRHAPASTGATSSPSGATKRPMCAPRCARSGPTARTSWCGSATERIAYRVGAPGAHIAQNSLAVVAALQALGADVEKAVPGLARAHGCQGPRRARRPCALEDGAILLIDESYNANPASMRSALAAMATVPRGANPRRIAVLGDMLELGAESGRLHEELKEPVDAAEVDLVFACGPNMKRLFAALPANKRGTWAETSEGIAAPLLAEVRAGDVVMIKGSLGSRMAPLVDALMRKGEQQDCVRLAGRE